MGRSRHVSYISQNQIKLLSKQKVNTIHEKGDLDLNLDLDSSNDRRSPLLQLQINKNLDTQTQVNVPSASTRKKCDDETAQNVTLQLCDENETTNNKHSQLNWSRKQKFKYDATFDKISKMKPDDSKNSPIFTAPNGGLEWQIGIKFKSGLTPRRLYFYLICASDLRPVKAVELDVSFNIKRRKCHSKSKKVVCEHHKKGSWFSMSSEPETILTINKLEKNIFGLVNNFVSWIDIMEPLNHIFDDDDKIMVEVVFHILNVQNLPQITQDLKCQRTIPFVNLGNKWVEKTSSKSKIQKKKKISQKDMIVNAIFRPKKLVTNSVATMNSPKMDNVSNWLLTTNLSTQQQHQQQQKEIIRTLNMDLLGLGSINKLNPSNSNSTNKAVKSNLTSTNSSEPTTEKKMHWKVKKSIQKQERLRKNKLKKSKVIQIKKKIKQINLEMKIEKNGGKKSSTTAYNYVKKTRVVKRKGRKSVKKPLLNRKQENEIDDDEFVTSNSDDADILSSKAEKVVKKLMDRKNKEIKGTKTKKSQIISKKLGQVEVQKSIKKSGRKKRTKVVVVVEKKIKSLQRSRNPGKTEVSTPPEKAIISKKRKLKNKGSSSSQSKIKKKIVSPLLLLAESPTDAKEIESSGPQTRNIEKPLNNTNNDCIHYFFKSGGCQRESYCPFRHSDVAKESYLVCAQWRKYGECSKWILCTKRHMSEEDIESYKRKYFIIDDE